MANIVQRIKFQLDGEDKVKNELKALSREQKNLIQAFRTGNSTYDEARKDLLKMRDSYGDAAQGARAYEAALKSLNDEQRLANSTQVNEDAFDSTSRQVALAGDVQSNLGAISGLAGAAGAGGLAQGIGIGGEIVALAEELPRLKESLKGMPSVINAAGKALGLGGGAGLLGALSITGIAIAAVGLAFKKFAEDAQKQANQLQAVIDANREVRTDIAQGLTSTDATAKLDELNRLREVELSLISDAQQQYDEQISSQNALFDTILKFSAQEQVLVDTINNGNATVTEYDTAIKLLTEAQTDGSLAANDAVVAEETLLAAREEAGQQLLEQAAFAGELVALQQESADFNVEELEAKRLSVEQTKAQVLAELALLEARSNGSEAVLNQIEALKTQIGQLDESLALLDSDQAKSAAATNTAREAEEALRKEREKAAKSTKTTTTRERSSSTASAGGFEIGSLGRRSASLVKSAVTPIEKGITDAYKSASEERMRLIQDFNRQETEIKRDAIFNQQQDLERFYFDQEQLLNQGSFTSAFRSAVDKNFQQGQDRNRLQFDTDNRRNDLTSQIQQLANSLQQQTVQLQIQPSREFNVRVVGGTANVITRVGGY